MEQDVLDMIDVRLSQGFSGLISLCHRLPSSPLLGLIRIALEHMHMDVLVNGLDVDVDFSLPKAGCDEISKRQGYL